MTLHGQCTVEDYLQANRTPPVIPTAWRVARQLIRPSDKTRRAVSALRLLGPGFLLAFAASAYLSVRVSPFWILVVFILVRGLSSFVALLRSPIAREGRDVFRFTHRHLLDPCIIKVDAGGFRFETGFWMQSLGWRRVAEMRETSGQFMIIDDRRHVVVVPKRFCANLSEEAEFRDLVRNSIAQAKEPA
jgi:hypothetical protein